MPKFTKTKHRRQRLKEVVTPTKPATVSAAVSIPEPLYISALGAAQTACEGNFSLYVRNLIRADLTAA